MICIKCHNEFVPLADHPGYVNVCVDCSKGDVPRLMAKVAWSGKHTVEIEVTTNRREAERFNALQKRYGVGVTKSLCESKIVNKK